MAVFPPEARRSSALAWARHACDQRQCTLQLNRWWSRNCRACHRARPAQGTAWRRRCTLRGRSAGRPWPRLRAAARESAVGTKETCGVVEQRKAPL